VGVVVEAGGIVGPTWLTVRGKGQTRWCLGEKGISEYTRPSVGAGKTIWRRFGLHDDVSQMGGGTVVSYRSCGKRKATIIKNALERRQN